MTTKRDEIVAETTKKLTAEKQRFRELTEELLAHECAIGAATDRAVERELREDANAIRRNIESSSRQIESFELILDQNEGGGDNGRITNKD